MKDLFEAVKENKLDKVEELLNNVANLNNIFDEDGNTPLHIAARGGHTKTVEALIAKGADVNIRDNDGRTPLFISALWGRTEIVKTLIGKGADVNIPDKYGITPLFIAASEHHGTCIPPKIGMSLKHMYIGEGGYRETVKALIDAKANVNIFNPFGATPIYFFSNDPEMQRFLFEHGAMPHMWEREKETPLDEIDTTNVDKFIEILADQLVLALKDTINYKAAVTLQKFIMVGRHPNDTKQAITGDQTSMLSVINKIIMPYWEDIKKIVPNHQEAIPTYDAHAMILGLLLTNKKILTELPKILAFITSTLPEPEEPEQQDINEAPEKKILQDHDPALSNAEVKTKMPDESTQVSSSEAPGVLEADDHDHNPDLHLLGQSELG